MKVGDYVRTKKDGIGRIISFSYQEDNECCFIELSNRRTGIKQFNIIKSSPNIIDLIEKNDIVNHSRVVCIGVSTDLNGIHKYLVLENGSNCANGNIKSIATKEQFESMEYTL